MAPWAGRIRGGRFTFEGIGHQLVVNHRDGDREEQAHAIHGLVFDRPWDDVYDVSDTTFSAARALEWPFGGIARQTIVLTAHQVVLTLSVESTGERFPAEIGWHPWFRKPERLEFSPTAMYERDEWGIPTGELVDPPPPPWDDCFCNTEAVTLHYDRPVAPVGPSGVRLRPLGRLRPAGPRHVRRAAVRSSRRLQSLGPHVPHRRPGHPAAPRDDHLLVRPWHPRTAARYPVVSERR